MFWEANRYHAQVVRWVDGDTVELLFDLSQNTLRQETYRLNGIDAAGVTRREAKSDLQKQAGLALTQYLRDTYAPGYTFEAATHKDPGKYGRYLVTLYTTSRNLNDWLLDMGLALPYGQSWTDADAQAALDQLAALKGG